MLSPRLEKRRHLFLKKHVVFFIRFYFYVGLDLQRIFLQMHYDFSFLDFSMNHEAV